MADLIKAAFAMGLLTLCVAVLVPTLVDATNDNAVDTRELTVGNQEEITDVLFVEVDNVNASTNDTTVTFQDSRTFESNTTTVGEGKSTTIRLSGETLDFTVKDVYGDNETVLVETTHDPTFGWNDGSKTFWDNIGLVVAMLGIMCVFGVVAVVLKQ